MKKLLLLILLSIIGINNTPGWVYPEHREIALQAIEKLSPSDRATLDNLWLEARKGNESRLSESIIDPLQTINPNNLDFAAWPAIAGDHSCSAEQMLDVVLRSDWILDVANINAELKINLALTNERADHINALRNSDLQLQKADPQYATRAGSNNVHFLLPLHDVDMEMQSYIDSCLTEGVEINAISAYFLYHSSALKKASRFMQAELTESERSELILSAFADEAFAIHFLEDIFAAGHAAGTWGDVSQRKGTHDYYNENGLKTSTWEGEKTVLMGDAWMRKVDAARAAETVSKSLEQFLKAVNGNYKQMFSGDETELTPMAFNVCQINFVPNIDLNPSFLTEVMEVIAKTPVPGLAKGLGDLPRFRAEVGPFIGFSPSLHASMIFGGFGKTENTIGLSGGLSAAIRFGVGLDGVLNEAGDGLAFLQLGWRQDGSSTTGIVDDPEFKKYGAIYAAIPGRSAFSARLRLPFYLIPGDLLIAGPILLLFDPEALTNMGVTAVNGGLIPWQLGIETSFGRFQFVLGREAAVYFFGGGKHKDALVVLGNWEAGEEFAYVVSYQSTQLEFPIIEYRPFRSFSNDQSSTLLIQLYGGVDIPFNVNSVEPVGVPAPQLQNVWYVGARLVFDWRHYF